MILHLKPSFIVVLVAAMFLSGCSTLKEVFTGTNADLIWQAATAQVIESGYVDGPTLVGYVDEAESYLDDTEVAEIGVMANALRARLNASDKPIASKIVLNRVIDTYEQKLEERIGAGILDPEEEVQLKTVLGWIRTAAQMYGA